MIPLPPFGHCPKKHTIWYLKAPKYNSHLMVMMMTVLTMLWRLHSGWGRLGEEEVGGGGSGWILVSSLLPLHQSAIWAPPASLRQQPPASSPVTTNWAISYFLFCFGLYLASIRSIPIPFHHLQLFPLSLKNEKTDLPLHLFCRWKLCQNTFHGLFKDPLNHHHRLSKIFILLDPISKDSSP